MDKSEILTKHVVITGRVQGVYFRAYTKDAAEQYKINGWVKNKSDGTVEAVIQGKKEDIEQMIQWFHTGSPASSVNNVIVKDKPGSPNFTEFEIKYI